MSENYDLRDQLSGAGKKSKDPRRRKMPHTATSLTTVGMHSSSSDGETGNKNEES